MTDPAVSECLQSISDHVTTHLITSWAAEFLAEDLNSHSHHFLLELLQNADDNDYSPAVVPRLDLRYDGDLVLSCNENGFTEENVKAICSVGKSTKGRSSSTTGEKGIGFKSVFRIAKEVTIYSGKWKFRLTKDNPFSPQQVTDTTEEYEGTRMIFTIPEAKKIDVREALEDFDPTNMTFLRRIRTICISIDGGNERKMERQDVLVDHRNSHVAILQNGEPLHHYNVMKFPITIEVSRRMGGDHVKTGNDSEVALGFPVRSDFQQLMITSRSEKVYAFVPIKSYDMKFAIHADFMLSANREEIHRDCIWNQELRNAIRDSIVSAFTIFGLSSTGVCSEWPMLLDLPTLSDHFFATLCKEVVQKLRNEPILKTETGGFERAGHLVHVPDKYRFRPNRGSPFPGSKAETRYLSKDFSIASTQNLIHILGVKEMDSGIFSHDLIHFGNLLYKQDMHWHSMLAKTILDDSLENQLVTVKLIPTHNNEWVDAVESMSGRVYFQSTHVSISVLPRGIPLHCIASEAHHDKYRQRLFLAWNAKDISSPESVETIVRMIQNVHTRSRPTRLSVKDLVSHARFIHYFRDICEIPSRFWVATQSKKANLAKETFGKSLVISGQKLNFPFLHASYKSGLSDADFEKFLEWMYRDLHLIAIPRLVVQKGDSCILSPEINYIMRYFDSLHFIDQLMKHWSEYSPWITTAKSRFQPEIRNIIASFKIDCLDSQLHPLNEAIYPSDGLIELGGVLPIALPAIKRDDLQVQRDKWAQLCELGFKMEPDLDDWIEYLRLLKGRMNKHDSAMGHKPTEQFTKIVYSGLTRSCQVDPGNSAKTRAAFENEALVFIPVCEETAWRKTGCWVSIRQCVWSLSSNFIPRYTFSLSKCYSHGELFKDILNVSECLQLHHLKYEAQRLNNKDLERSTETLRYIVELLLAIKNIPNMSHECRESDIYEISTAFRECVLFPIREATSVNAFDKLVSAEDDEEWFIGDRRYLCDGFQMQLRLLALTVSEIEDVAEVLSMLGLDRRRLSYRLWAPLMPVVNAASEWVEKAQYIDRLIPIELHPFITPMRRMTINVSRFESDTRFIIQGVGKSYHGTISTRKKGIVFRNADILHVCVQAGCNELSRTSTELAEDFSLIFRIPPAKRLYLQHIVAEKDLDQIQISLQDWNIPHVSVWKPVLQLERFIPKSSVSEQMVMAVTSNRGVTVDTPNQHMSNTDEERSFHRNLLGLDMSPDPITMIGDNQTIDRRQPQSARHDRESEEYKYEDLSEDLRMDQGQGVIKKVVDSDINEEQDRSSQFQAAVVSATSTAVPTTIEPYQSMGETPIRRTKVRSHVPSKTCVLEDPVPKPLRKSCLDLDSMTVPDTPQDDHNQFTGDLGPIDMDEYESEAGCEPDAVMTEQEVDALKEVFPPRICQQVSTDRLANLSPAQRIGRSSVIDFLLNSRLPIQQIAKTMKETSPAATEPQLPAGGNLSDWSSLSYSADPSTMDDLEITREISADDPELTEALTRLIRGEPREFKDKSKAKQYSGRMETSMPSQKYWQAKTNVLFVTNPELLPSVYRGGTEKLGTTAVLESRLRIPRNPKLERSVYAWLPMTAKSFDKEAQFHGQLLVSQLFRRLLSSHYRPEEHWTSPFCRTMYPRAPLSEGRIPFQFHDVAARQAFTSFLSTKFGVIKTKHQCPPHYRLNVAVTRDSRDSRVELLCHPFDDARKSFIAGDDTTPDHIHIFVHVSNIDSVGGPPIVGFYIDPWSLYMDDMIDVCSENDRHYIQFKASPHFCVEDREFQAYKWEKLNGDMNIRLLRLKKGRGSQDLVGLLEEYDLSSSTSLPAYTAISYAWGSSLKQLPLSIEDNQRVANIRVPVSLYLALRQIRPTQDSILIWADAICTDQNCSEEKESQINLLSKIFQKAQLVFAWLGHDDDGCSEGVDLLRKIGDIKLPDPVNAKRQKHHSGTPQFTLENLPEMADPRWSGVTALLRKSWFTRIWTVQEAVLAPELIIGCGDKVIPWDILHDAATLCFMQGLFHPNIGHGIADKTIQKNILKLGELRSQAWVTPCTFREPDDMFQLLQLFHQKNVTEPRDRLFALLALAKDGSERHFSPDYEATEEAVILRYASVFVKQGYTLDLLYQARLAWKRSKLPSWVPDLTANNYPRTVASWAKNIRAGREPRTLHRGQHKLGFHSKQPKVKDGVLILHGYKIDRIHSISKITSHTSNPLLYVQDIYATIEATYSRSNSMSKDDRRETMMRTLPVGGLQGFSLDINDNGDSDVKRQKRSYQALRAFLDINRNGNTSDWSSLKWEIFEAVHGDNILSYEGNLRKMLWPYLNTVTSFADVFEPSCAVACQTEKNRVGIVPATASSEFGDEIVVFQGAKVPHILRPISRCNEIYYTVVGECYIDGIMHGELFERRHKASSLQIQEFRLN